MTIGLNTTGLESAASAIRHITLEMKLTSKRSAGNPPAPFDVAGAGDGPE